ncbi:hypothetical protein [Methylomagnum sp.]
MQDNRHESGFVAGTPVWTDRGLVPIEQIKIGDSVLSRSEEGRGEREFKRVRRTLIHDNLPITLVNYVITWPNNDPQNKWDEYHYRDDYLFVSDHLQFWVRDDFDTDEGCWKSTGWLVYGEPLSLMTDKIAYVGQDMHLCATDIASIGWISYHDQEFPDFCVDFGSKGKAKWPLNTKRRKPTNRQVTRCVYNLEVEDFHTFYVSDEGVWVHDASPPVSQAGA